MKKFAFTLVAVSALGLAACDPSSTDHNSAGNEAITTNEAVSDVNDAGTAADNALNGVVEGGSDLANGASNVASDVGSAVSNGASEVANEVDGNSATR